MLRAELPVQTNSTRTGLELMAVLPSALETLLHAARRERAKRLELRAFPDGVGRPVALDVCVTEAREKRSRGFGQQHQPFHAAPTRQRLDVTHDGAAKARAAQAVRHDDGAQESCRPMNFEASGADQRHAVAGNDEMDQRTS